MSPSRPHLPKIPGGTETTRHDRRDGDRPAMARFRARPGAVAGSWLLASVAFASVAACYVGPLADDDGARSDVSRSEAGADGRGPSTPGAEGGGANPSSGLPCDVDAVLAARCRSCHATPLAAPMTLLTYEDLVAPSRSDASRKVVDVAIERMRSATRPMPPSGSAPQADVGVLEEWVGAGLPRGACGAIDGGADGATQAPIVSVCTSGTRWSSGNEKSPRMNPGLPCLTCHQRENDRRERVRAPDRIGGTVYPTVREPDLCNGAPGDATIVLTDATGRTFDLPVNEVGNFYAFSSDVPGITFPIRAKVVRNGRERAMSTPQSTGDCNSFHTEAGRNGAPGRIFLP